MKRKETYIATESNTATDTFDTNEWRVIPSNIITPGVMPPSTRVDIESIYQDETYQSVYSLSRSQVLRIDIKQDDYENLADELMDKYRDIWISLAQK